MFSTGLLHRQHMLFAFFILVTIKLQIHAYPYPQPFAHPAVETSITQQNQFVNIFDKTQFKPPELEETIEEVQKILQKDPSLPRLTRGEIEELYEKVTREEYQKSVESGDLGRADSMRALMLVLPYNTDNSTSDHLQELYTRPPVTKVIDGYTQHQPIKFITPNSSARADYPSGQLAATTYKPGLPFNVGFNPTTYHPLPPAPFLTQQLTPSVPETLYDFQPITKQPVEASQPVQRYSSHYNAKNTDFLKLNAQKKQKNSQTSTVRPVADVLESLGIVSQTQSRKRFTIDDYYPAESAPRPVISSYIPLNGDFDGLRGQNIAPKITSDAYSSFKPLNIGEEIRVKPEVEDYLTRFGIVGGRKRKALKKSNTKTEFNDEQSSAGSELNAASLPSNAKNGNTELEKLLQNLQELERLNESKKKATTTTTTTTTTPAPTTTTTTTENPSASLITNGAPMLIEPKKPRRRIDPHIDINFGATGNQQPISTNDDQLAKLLDNLQELEKLRLNPENVLKKVAPTIKSGKVAATRPISTTTTTPATLILSSDAQNEQQEFERILKQLQQFEKSNVRTTTKKPKSVQQNVGAPFDLLQLRKLLTDDNELERLYEQARARVAPSTTPRKTSTTTTTTSTTTTTTTTPKPWTSDFEFEQLQKYIAELDRARTSTTSTTTTTTSTTPPPTTTTSTTPPPTTTTTTTTTRPTKKVTTDDPKIQELINRVQQLEKLNSDNSKPVTESTLPYLGFTSRNVKAPVTATKATADDYRVPTNDFAQLQQLYLQVQEADRASFAHVEISTAATASKHSQKGKQTQDFAQRLLDFSNDTGSGNSFQKVEPNDFVQLQKLLSKVQELERVKINANGLVESTTENPRNKQATFAPSLVTASSIQAPTVQRPNAQIIYPEKSDKYLEFLDDVDDLKLAQPTPKTSTVSKKSGAQFPEIGSDPESEELRELAYSKAINPKQSSLDRDFERYQEFFSSLEDAGERQSSYRDSYDKMEPPMIQKTVPKEPTRFFPTKKPHEIMKPTTTLTNEQQADLNELQKLLSNAQELGKLGVTLPKSLADQIESKLTKTTEVPTTKPTIPSSEEPKVNVYLDRYGLKPKTTIAPSEKVAVFSLTTPKSPTPKQAKPTTDSPLGLPVFSATKIIEAAIKQAATRIGVTTEQPQGFRRRSDVDIADLDLEDSDDDMLGEFSEMNYQIAIPEINRMDELVDESRATKPDDVVKPEDITEDLSELQRLIGNLRELQKLNISISTDMLRLADKKYLESFMPQLSTADETGKSRRQSATLDNTDSSTATNENKSPTESSSTASPTTSTTVSSTTESTNTTEETASTTPIIAIPTTPTAPTLVNLGIGLDESDADTAESNDKTVSSSSTSTTTTEETSTTDEPRNGSLADLEASFGPDPNKQEPLPPKKKNGFYFLADWNSFLEVGADDDQVIVRFNPKIGDPRLFLPVKTP